ncbi:TetR/AcrR family transcriptional regulator [Nonomuraea sp. NPDC005983]|uniref:TetR/AcrR family transcriptional regulator n=1 Tax=Nonomuraea sp. NPDC005983 TaxID=3155595 RepID=UPI0033B5B0BC
MARPRMFDEDRAVEAAMRAFWDAGYEATSTQDLCEATGLGRSSIYNTFKSKHDLFEKALRRYMSDRTAPIIALLEGPLPVREKIRALLWRVIDTEAGDPIGCLVVNATVELGPRDPEIADQLARNLGQRKDALIAALTSARRDGEIGADRDPEALAEFVIAVIGGMQVAARGGATPATLEQIATTALAAL